MPLISNSASVIQGRPSVLAIAETILASGFTIWLTVKHQSASGLLLSGLLAPLMLLRTKLSTRYALRVLSNMGRGGSGVGFADGVAAMPVILIFSPFIKIFSNIKSLIRYPFKTISNIPENFYLSTFVTDLRVPPHVVPGYYELNESQRGSEENLQSFNAYVGLIFLTVAFRSEFRKEFEEEFWKMLPTILVSALIIVPITILTLWFRYSIKSTAFVWLPLLWVIRQSSPGKNIIERIDYQYTPPVAELVLLYSFFVALLFVTKLFIYAGVWEIRNIHVAGYISDFANRWVDPIHLTGWQIASFVNAIMAFITFCWAKRQLRAHDRTSTERYSVNCLTRCYVTYQAIRTTLSLYAIACTFYIVAAVAYRTDWPAIRVVLFPT